MSFFVYRTTFILAQTPKRIECTKTITPGSCCRTYRRPVGPRERGSCVRHMHYGYDLARRRFSAFSSATPAGQHREIGGSSMCEFSCWCCSFVNARMGDERCSKGKIFCWFSWYAIIVKRFVYMWPLAGVQCLPINFAPCRGNAVGAEPGERACRRHEPSTPWGYCYGYGSAWPCAWVAFDLVATCLEPLERQSKEQFTMGFSLLDSMVWKHTVFSPLYPAYMGDRLPAIVLPSIFLCSQCAVFNGWKSERLVEQLLIIHL